MLVTTTTTTKTFINVSGVFSITANWGHTIRTIIMDLNNKVFSKLSKKKHAEKHFISHVWSWHSVNIHDEFNICIKLKNYPCGKNYVRTPS